MKSLVVEDDFVSRRILQKVLSKYGPCDITVNGQEALTAFKMAWEENEPYDLVCLDIMMPEMDGFEVLKEIRVFEDERGIFGLEGVKVIMTTALDDPKTIMRAFKEQCEDYLVKPINLDRLDDIIKRHRLI